jgi:hypothetical protein
MPWLLQCCLESADRTQGAFGAEAVNLTFLNFCVARDKLTNQQSQPLLMLLKKLQQLGLEKALT